MPKCRGGQGCPRTAYSATPFFSNILSSAEGEMALSAFSKYQSVAPKRLNQLSVVQSNADFLAYKFSSISLKCCDSQKLCGHNLWVMTITGFKVHRSHSMVLTILM
jgi:hypothetical protein